MPFFIQYNTIYNTILLMYSLHFVVTNFCVLETKYKSHKNSIIVISTRRGEAQMEQRERLEFSGTRVQCFSTTKRGKSCLAIRAWQKKKRNMLRNFAINL